MKHVLAYETPVKHLPTDRNENRKEKTGERIREEGDRPGKRGQRRGPRGGHGEERKNRKCAEHSR